MGLAAVQSRSLSESDLYPSTPSSSAQSVPSSVLSATVVHSDRGWLSPAEQTMAIHTVRSWVAAHLAPLRALPHNWDSYGGRPVDELAAQAAEQLITQLLLQRVRAPEFFPRPDGGLSIEWHGPTVELAIELPPGAPGASAASVYYSDEQAEVEWEKRLSDAMPQVREILGNFVIPVGG